jgi:hypothetical protein
MILIVCVCMYVYMYIYVCVYIYIYISHFLYPFISWWATELIPYIGYYEYCCYEQDSAII